MQFRIINKEISSNVDEQQTLYITGIANSGTEDLVGDTVTRQALEQICTDATNHNLHLDHDTGLEGLIGTIVEAELVDEGVLIKARILDERRDEIESLLQQGVKLGLSISGVTTCNDENPSLIDEWILTEISLTPIPCDQATMGTVAIAKSFKEFIDINGKTKQQNNNDEEEKEEEEETSTKTEETGGDNMAEETIITEENVIELINTAFAEKQEELLETIRGELKEEYESKINAQEERIAALEAQIEALKEEKPATGEEEETKAGEEEEEEEQKKDPEEEEEEIEKKLVGVLSKILGVKPEDNTPSFRYEPSSKKASSEKKGYTPRELAEMMANQ